MNKKEIMELLKNNNIEASKSDMNFLEKLSKLDEEQLNLVEKTINELKEK